MVLYKEDFLKQRMFIFGSFCHLTIFLLQLPSKKLISVSSSHLSNLEMSIRTGSSLYVWPESKPCLSMADLGKVPVQVTESLGLLFCFSSLQ